MWIQQRKRCVVQRQVSLLPMPVGQDNQKAKPSPLPSTMMRLWLETDLSNLQRRPCIVLRQRPSSWVVVRREDAAEVAAVAEAVRKLSQAIPMTKKQRHSSRMSIPLSHGPAPILTPAPTCRTSFIKVMDTDRLRLAAWADKSATSAVQTARMLRRPPRQRRKARWPDSSDGSRMPCERNAPPRSILYRRS